MCPCVVVGRMSCSEASCDTMRVTLFVSVIFCATSLPARARMPSMPVG